MSMPLADTAGTLERATSLLASGQPAEAAALARRALEHQADSVPALALLGAALHAEARFAEAEPVFLRLTELVPQEPLHWMNVGSARRCAGRSDEALQAFARAAALGAATRDFYYNVALTHLQRQDFESARSLFERALALDPSDLEARYGCAQCCYERHRTDEAQALLADWERHAQPGQRVVGDIGQLLLLLGESERAERALRMALDGAPTDPELRLKLLQALERTNRVTEARQQLDALLADDDTVVRLGTDLTLAQAQIAEREGDHELACRLYRHVLEGRRELHERHFDLFPLAKSLDGLGRYDEAFVSLEEAHRSQIAYLRRAAPLASLRGAPMMVIAEHGCDPADVTTWRAQEGPAAAASPVFVVAFPRSGTTLLEMALDAHPLLRSMDEQPFLHNALDDMAATGVRYPTELGRLTSAQLDAIRESYWQRVRARIRLKPGQRLVDKNPLNLLRLPVIRRLFPNAHVLLAIRHPCDVLLSCFMQHFRAPEFALLCQRLPMLASGYRKAFDFWYQEQALLQAQVLELRYETFVADFSTEVRATIDFIGLPWDERVLAPGRRAAEKRYISTPSYSQVVQPITSKAVGRWRNYQSHFAEVLPMLQPLLERWGYDS
jgi:Flp pilus assembly protein TadD